MMAYFVRRLLYMIAVVVIVSIVAFVIIQLPPGDFLTTYVTRLEAEEGQQVSRDTVSSLREQYGLNRSPVEQYLRWVSKMFHGDFGISFEHNRPVLSLIGERLPLTIIISLITLIFTYAVAIPIGIYSATHQYSFMDYVVTVLGFIGLAVPNFLLALVLMFFFYKYLNINVGGLFSFEYIMAPWSVAKFFDMLSHLLIPVIVIGLSGTASIIRTMRSCLLDEINKQYVTTARAKGVREGRLLLKYPVRLAINPIISTIGWLLPEIVSGSTIVSIVLNLPTTGPLLFNALLSQDMFLAGGIVMFLTLLTVLGTFISDILLMVADPRIRT